MEEKNIASNLRRKLGFLFLLAGSILFAASHLPFRCLWPSFISLACILAWKKVLPGLALGATTGVFLLESGHPYHTFIGFFRDHLIPSLQSRWNVCVIIFTLMLGGFAAVIEHSGGFQVVLNRLTQRFNNLKSGVQWSGFSIGLLCFFDGLANSMIVGKSLTPLAKRAGVSREKLSYLVDSTSASVACVAFISTWIAYQLAMIREGFSMAGRSVNSYGIFLSSIPLNFYCWFTLGLLGIVIYRQWNIGPMKDAESKAARELEPICHPLNPNGSVSNPSSAIRSFLPLVFLVLCLLAGLYISGSEGAFRYSITGLAEAFGKADAALVLVCSAAAASILALLMSPPKSGESSPMEVYFKGVSQLLPAVLILVGAWTLSSTLKELNTADYLSGILSNRMPVALIPAGVFAAGSLISFTTGTSWGTMGILMPLALPIILNLSNGLDPETSQMLVSGTVAAVFSGAVFGDHCSPFSDTTIVSAIACDLNPWEHVRTQLPYSLITAATALVFGFIPLGAGIPFWICLAAGIIFLLLLPTIHLKIFSKPAKITHFE